MLGKRIARASGLIVLVGLLASCGSVSPGNWFSSTTTGKNRQIAAEQAQIDRQPALRTQVTEPAVTDRDMRDFVIQDEVEDGQRRRIGADQQRVARVHEAAREGAVHAQAH